jgi:SAM-dependent methyltransferase
LDGVQRVADLGCGAGADTIALAQAGLQVHAVDLDPDAIVAARHNASVAGVGDRVTFSLEDALTTDLAGVDVVMVDPARRDAAGRRLLNPGQWSPTYEQVLAISRRVPSLVAKLGPGVDHSLLPYASDTEWVQDGDDLVEAALWTGHLSTRSGRRAVLLRDDSEFVVAETDMPSGAPTIAGVGKYVYEPQPAVIRAGLVGVTLGAVNGWLLDRAIAYVMADDLVATPTATAYRVIAEVPFAVKKLRAELQERGYGNVIVKKRGVATDPEELRKSLRLSGDAGTAIVMLTRTAAGPLALLVEAV